jgi:hypothetical protein
MSRTRVGVVITMVFSLAGAVFGVSPLGAECRLATTNLGGSTIFATPTAPVGQSFVACQDGLITNIAVFVGLSNQPSVRLGLQPGTDLLAPTYSELGTIPPDAARIRFTPGFPVTNGMVYSLSLTPISGVLSLPLVLESSYAEGTALAVEQGVSVALESDLEFAVTISDPVVPAVVATWGALKSLYR